MPEHDPFDLLSAKVDLDDPAQYCHIHRFMLGALSRVSDSLSATSRSAILIAKRHLDGHATVGNVATMRVKLWDEIHGRDQSNEVGVLRVRTVICAMHGMDAAAASDTLHYFLMFWQESELSMVELAKAMREAYGVSYQPG